MTMKDTWGYKRGDTNWKSAGKLLHNLVDIASKGGNFLLNVQPDRATRLFLHVFDWPTAEHHGATGA